MHPKRGYLGIVWRGDCDVQEVTVDENVFNMWKAIAQVHGVNFSLCSCGCLSAMCCLEDSASVSHIAGSCCRGKKRVPWPVVVQGSDNLRREEKDCRLLGKAEGRKT